MQAPAHTPAGQLRITGVLLDHAQHLHTAGQASHALVRACVSTGAGLPCDVLQDLGTGPSAHIAAERKARLLRRGAAVTVVCRGALPRTDHATAVLRCVDVIDLIPHHLPADPTQPAGTGA